MFNPYFLTCVLTCVDWDGGVGWGCGMGVNDNGALGDTFASPSPARNQLGDVLSGSQVHFMQSS